jgi:hypothetical protein
MRKAKLQQLHWSQFDQKRTRETGGTADVLLDNIVSLTMPAGSSHREAVEHIACQASKPFPIVSISKLLDENKSLRGRVYYGDAGQQIDKILHNYPRMRWWMEKDGLVIDAVPLSANRLSDFDQKAGKLVCEGTTDGKLSADSVRQIAAGLDAAGFSLSESLQPAQWKPIADHNRKHAKSAIKTFAAAVSHPKFVRSIRLRLYVARERYQKAYGSFPS